MTVNSTELVDKGLIQQEDGFQIVLTAGHCAVQNPTEMFILFDGNPPYCTELRAFS
jgi:hypothetical protein